MTIGYQYILLMMIMTVCFYMTMKMIRERGMVYCRSTVDNEYYLVRDKPDKLGASNLLATLRKNINGITDYMVDRLNNKMKEMAKDEELSYKVNGQYINRLDKLIRGVILMESHENSVYTSYSVNKGEQIVFCIRSKNISNVLNNTNQIHDLNLIMYVALHEISHVACPERDHTPLFNKIFRFICNEAIKMGIYKRMDFRNNPEEYCGMTITDSII